MKSDRFYLACLRDTVGSNAAFHCRNGHGYSSDLDKAHVYTRQQAQKEWDTGRYFDLPLCAEKIDALSVYHVDCQHVPEASAKVISSDRYVAYKKGRWDGNDLYWLSGSGNITTDFSKAAFFDEPSTDENDENYAWLPFSMADSVKRRTFSISLLDRRRMIQAAGLITPEHVKRQQRRSTSGKSRWNCPGCGQIHWQHNPYDFDGCRNLDCESWRPLP